MPYLFTKNTDPTIVLAPREALRAPLNFGDEWTEVRVGIFLTGVSAWLEDEKGSLLKEDLPIADVSDHLTFGLSKAGISALPGQVDSLFLGIRSDGATAEARPVNTVTPPTTPTGRFSGAFSQCCAVGYDGATLVNGGVIADGALRFPSVEDPAAFNGFYSLKIRITNRGLSSQKVHFSVASIAAVSSADYSPATLRDLINNTQYGAEVTIAWNTGSAARDIPDTVWFRIPFYNFRARIHALRAINYVP